jgi:hypothetical protein
VLSFQLPFRIATCQPPQSKPLTSNRLSLSALLFSLIRFDLKRWSTLPSVNNLNSFIFNRFRTPVGKTWGWVWATPCPHAPHHEPLLAVR